MIVEKNKNRKTFSGSNFTIVLIILYIILFEFTWITQNIFPKPSLIIESFFSLIKEYHLIISIIETTAIIYPSIIVAFVIIELFNRVIIKISIEFRGIANIAAPFKYMSFLFFALLLNVLFPHSFSAEFSFAFLFVLFSLFKLIIGEIDLLTDEYIVSAKSMGISDNQILSGVIWQSLKPKVYKNAISIHLQLWIAILVYEFIGSSVGVGAIYRIAFNYNDLLGIISLGLFTSVIILLLNSVLKIIISKLVFWE